MRLQRSFFERDVLDVAPNLLGKILVRKFDDGTKIKKVITEVEAYKGEEDLACHARCGKTERNKVMYEKGGHVYVYFVYGMYWMLNIVTGRHDVPQAVLIRSLNGMSGPGRVGKLLKLDKSFYGEDVTKSNRIWIEDTPGLKKVKYKKSARVGVNYAGNWSRKKWRFILPSLECRQKNTQCQEFPRFPPKLQSRGKRCSRRKPRFSPNKNRPTTSPPALV